MITTRFLPQKTTDSMLSSFKDGIRFVRKQGSMEALIFLAFCMTALSMPLRTYFPVFVKDIFHRGPETYGQLLSVMGIGSICGSLAIASLGNFRHKGMVAVSMLMCLGAAITGFAFSKSLPLSYLIVLLVGFSMMAVFATVNSLVQLITTDDMRGRIMSVYNFAFRGGMPMGNLMSGWLVPLFGAPSRDNFADVAALAAVIGCGEDVSTPRPPLSRRATAAARGDRSGSVDRPDDGLAVGTGQSETFFSSDRSTKPPAISSRPITMNQIPSRVARALTEFAGTVTTTMPAARLITPNPMTQPR